jgi:hypothetical protein
MSATFWLLRMPDDQTRVRWVDSEYERMVCPEDPGTLRLGARIAGSTVRADPRALKGFAWNLDPFVSPKTLRLLRDEGVTGFETRPIKIVFPDDVELTPPGLHELLVTGWGGFAAPAAGVRLVDACSTCGLRDYEIADPSRLIDPEAWDGSDLFVVWPAPQYFFASDRLAGILRREQVSGLELIPAADIPREKGARIGISPRALASFMPADRARELEHRFGLSNWLVEPGRPNSHPAV